MKVEEMTSDRPSALMLLQYSSITVACIGLSCWLMQFLRTAQSVLIN